MIVLVIVVPMLAPIIIGTAVFRSIDDDATAVTIMAVVVELLCIKAVDNSPINRPINGLEAALIISSIAPSPVSLNDSPMRSRANRKMNIPQPKDNSLFKNNSLDPNEFADSFFNQ